MTGKERAENERSWATRVLQRRHEIGLRQDQVAKLAGITQQGLSRIELGRTTPRIQTMEALAKALGTNVKDLFPIESRPRHKANA